MDPLTPEQATVVSDVVVDGANVVLCANYGSGKTTVVLRVVDEVKRAGGQALCLVYNASMKCEMRTAVDVSTRHTIHTVHSAAQYIFEGVCGSTDDGITQSLDADVSARGYDLITRTTHIIVDEAQDIKPLFYDFVSLLVGTVARVAGRVPSLLLVGDAMQEVNRWNGSDARFMTMAPELEWGGVAGGWRRRELTITFRCPGPVVAANNRMTGLDVASWKAVPVKPVLHFCNMWDRSSDNVGLRQIVAWSEEGFSHADVLVLVPSLKASTPSSVLQTLLSDAGIASYQPMKDDHEGGLDTGLYLNKVRFCTFHACKGMEAECVLAICFDQQCEWLSAGYPDLADLPPPYHVAMTRCKSRVSLLHGACAPPVPSIRTLIIEGSLGDHFDVAGDVPSVDACQLEARERPERTYSVTEFVDSYLCPRSMEEAIALLDATTVGPVTMTDEVGGAVYADSAPNTVPSRAHAHGVEDVACLNGSIAELVVACALQIPFNSVPALKSLMSPGGCTKFKASDLTFDKRTDMRMAYAVAKEETGLVDLHMATLASLIHKFKGDHYTTLMSQIRDDVWWTAAHREAALETLDTMLRRISDDGDGGEAKQHGVCTPKWLTGQGSKRGGTPLWVMDVACKLEVCEMRLVGRADFARSGVLLETKYVTELTSAHVTQLALYARALEVGHDTVCCLLNLKSGEYVHFRAGADRTEAFCQTLRLKQRTDRPSDAEFLRAYGALARGAM